MKWKLTLLIFSLIIFPVITSSNSCCVYNNGEYCTPNSEMEACADQGGTFFANDVNCENSLCEKGCCDLVEVRRMETAKSCSVLSLERGLEMNFDINFKNEALCVFGSSDVSRKGACVVEVPYEENTCTIETQNACNGIGGNFYSGSLCTDEYLNTNCKPTEETTCLESGSRQGVYFVDSCGNIANIYDASKVNDENYWKTIIPDTQACALNNNFAGCGNCNFNFGSVCGSSSESDIKPTYGDNVCISTDCKDAPTRISSVGKVLETSDRKNGESWCLYDSAIGDEESPFGNNISVDPVGSLHWKASCINGEVEVEKCGDYRNSICVESQIEDPNTNSKLLQGVCTSNAEAVCYNYNSEDNKADMIEKCTNNSLCRVHSVYVDTKFNFEACVAKNPTSFKLKDLTSEEEEMKENTCGIASITCTAILVEDWDGDKTWINKYCLTPVFAKEMNDFCVSLGDCGSYVNYIGEGTENIKVNDRGVGHIKGEDYSEFEEAIGGKILQDPRIDEAIGGSAIAMAIETINDYLNKQSGISRAGGGGLIKSEQVKESEGWTNVILTSFRVPNELWKTYKDGKTTNLIEAIKFSNEFVFETVATIFGHGARTKVYKMKFTCQPWEAPAGGDDCSVCNDDPLGRPCTEYKCNSLGQACYLVNGDTDNPTCEALAQESTAPKITTANLSEGFRFKETTGSSTKVYSTESSEGNQEYLKRFENMNFTLNTDEFAQCKFSYANPLLEGISNYIDMSGELHKEEGSYTMSHTFGINTGIIDYSNAVDLRRDEELRKNFYDMKMYIKCQDYWGNYNTGYEVNFCVYEDDLEVVDGNKIEFEPARDSYLKYKLTNQTIIMNLPEPATCKYSTTSGVAYESMTNEMDCTTFDDQEDEKNLENVSSDLIGDWLCVANLKNLSVGENKFYFKCNDSVGNVNQGDIEYRLFVSEGELEMSEIEFRTEFSGGMHNADEYNTLIIGNTPKTTGVNVQMIVTTSKGAIGGVSNCSWKINGDGDTYSFLETDKSVKTQILAGRTKGKYEVYVKCYDVAGNEVENKTEFVLDIDNDNPVVSRVYTEGGEIILTTNEDARCYFSTNEVQSCSFDVKNATLMSTGFSRRHNVEWFKGFYYYVKCYDKWENMPSGCSKIIQTSKF